MGYRLGADCTRLCIVPFIKYVLKQSEDRILLGNYFYTINVSARPLIKAIYSLQPRSVAWLKHLFCTSLSLRNPFGKHSRPDDVRDVRRVGILLETRSRTAFGKDSGPGAYLVRILKEMRPQGVCRVSPPRHKPKIHRKKNPNQ